MNELISVIIPLYNKENAVANCLESITKHTDYDVEIIKKELKYCYSNSFLMIYIYILMLTIHFFTA